MTGAEIPVAMAIAGAEAGTAMGATAASMIPAAIGAGTTAAGLGAAGMAAGEAAGMGAPFSAAAPTFGGMGAASPFATSAMSAGAPMPFFTEAASLGAAGDPMAMGVTMAQPSLSMGAPLPSTPTPPWQKMATNMAGQMGRGMLQDSQQQPAAPAQRPPQAGTPQSNAEILKRIQMMQGPRSNFGGLLAQAMGR